MNAALITCLMVDKHPTKAQYAARQRQKAARKALVKASAALARLSKYGELKLILSPEQIQQLVEAKECGKEVILTIVGVE